MNNTWKSAGSYVEKLAQELSTKSRAEVLAMPSVSESNRKDAPAGFTVRIVRALLLNGASSVTVEAGRFILFGYRWRSVIAGFRVTPEGQLKHYPLRHVNQSAAKRKRHLTWSD